MENIYLQQLPTYLDTTDLSAIVIICHKRLSGINVTIISK